MSDPSTRVVLVKPGDVLIFGNVGECFPEDTEALAPMLETLKFATGVAHIVMFENDIDLAAVPRG